MTDRHIATSAHSRIRRHTVILILFTLFLGSELPVAQTAFAGSSAVTAQSTNAKDWVWPTLRKNTAYAIPSVRTVQYLLNARGGNLKVDGVFGAKTKAAVRAFQRSHRLAVDGIVNQYTWSALLITVQRGRKGSAVRAAQDQLTYRGLPGDPTLIIDGIFGPKTQATVIYFQRRMADLRKRETNGRESFMVDGIVGPQTWQALVLGYFRAG